MKLLKCLAFLVFIFSVKCIAQNDRSVEKGLFKVNFLTPGLAYEIGLSDFSTLHLEAGSGFIISGGSNRNTDFSFFPYFQPEYRYYYNFKRRNRLEKNVTNNSANYFAGFSRISSGKALIGDRNYSSDYFTTYGVLYGLQRTYSSGFNLGFQLGAGVEFNDEWESNFGPQLGFSLGWVINSHKNRL
ncbi:MAG: DUF3575 domain-containing protein [Leeuwenhoekiella sp.]